MQELGKRFSALESVATFCSASVVIFQIMFRDWALRICKLGLEWSGSRGASPEGGGRGRGAGTTLKLGGGQTSPGVQGNPYPKIKTPRIWPTIFWGENQVHVQKQTKINMNDNDSPKLGGGAPTASKLWGKLPPLPPRFPRP